MMPEFISLLAAVTLAATLAIFAALVVGSAKTPEEQEREDKEQREYLRKGGYRNGPTEKERSPHVEENRP